jgi:hypothetical protein
MDIAIGQIIAIDNPSDYKIHFAVGNGQEEPLDVFVRDREEWKGWNSWKGRKDDFSRKYVFSLIRYYLNLKSGSSAGYSRLWSVRQTRTW